MGSQLGELARQLWREVRDAGAQGMQITRLIERHSNLIEVKVRSTVSYLKTAGYLAQAAGPGSVYVVDVQCKVPRGESRALGPGWDEAETDDEMPERRAGPWVRTTLGVGSVFELGSRAQALAQTGAAAESQTARTAQTAEWPDRITSSTIAGLAPRPFRSALTSDGTLVLNLRDGRDVEVDAGDTRTFFAWLDRLSGLDLSSTLPTAQGSAARVWPLATEEAR